MTVIIRNVESLQEYFTELGRKVRVEHAKGLQQLSERERWEVVHQEHPALDDDEHSQLIMGVNAARQTREMAGSVLGSL